MAQIIWTKQAFADLEKIHKFIRLDSIYYADFFIQKIIKSVDRLEFFPESGRIVPETNKKEIREVILSDYRIVYKFQNSIISVIAVYHGAKKLEDIT